MCETLHGCIHATRARQKSEKERGIVFDYSRLEVNGLLSCMLIGILDFPLKTSDAYRLLGSRSFHFVNPGGAQALRGSDLTVNAIIAL